MNSDNMGQMTRRMYYYQLTLIFSFIFALVGFSYNVWRLEHSEQNNTIRTASFELLKELAGLEQIIYAAHYDADAVAGNPRKGWVKVGLIADLSLLTDDSVINNTGTLKKVWSKNWDKINTDRAAVDQIVSAIDQSRESIKVLLMSLN